MSGVAHVLGAWCFRERLDAVSWLTWPVGQERPIPFETIVFYL